MLQINIMDYDTETELDGVKYSIVDSKGEIVQEASVYMGNNVLIRGLKVREKLIRSGRQRQEKDITGRFWKKKVISPRM